MRSNQPDFNPLTPTPEEADQMLAGYIAAGPSGPGFRPDPVSMAYEHGWRMRRNDLAGFVDNDQSEIAKRLRENERVAAEIREEAKQRRQRLRGALRGPSAKFRP